VRALNDRDLSLPYAEPGTDAARIRALEQQVRILGEQVADLHQRIRDAETMRKALVR
jgi:Ser/Thr protein kinase RdoA (MazF antagonist)